MLVPLKSWSVVAVERFAQRIVELHCDLEEHIGSGPPEYMFDPI